MQKNPDIDIFSSSGELMSGGKISRRKIAWLIIVIAAVVIAASALLFFFFIKPVPNERISNNYAVIYTKGGNTILKSNLGECQVALEYPNEAVKSNDGKKLFYLTQSSYGSGKLDLHCCLLDDSSQVTKGGFIVDFGIENGFYINRDGNYIIYSKMNDDEGAAISYLYSIKDKKSTEITSGIDSVFACSNIDKAYFTKKIGTSLALYEYPFGGIPQKLAVDVKNVMPYTFNGKYELLYEVADIRTQTSSLFIISDNNSPKLISEGVCKVLNDQYKAGGNLYFLKKSESNASWRDIIPDDYKTQDDEMKEPQKSDYSSFFGVSLDYNKALKEYQEKLDRDALRLSLDKVVTDEKLIPELYNCFSYENGSIMEIAEGVSIDGISAITQLAEPMIIYKKVVCLPGEKNFSDLTEIMKNSSQQDAVKYAAMEIKKAIVTKGFYISYSNNLQGISLNADDNDSEDGTFRFSPDGKTIYFLAKDSQGEKSTLYKYSIVNGSLSERSVIDVNVTSLDFYGDKLLYLQLDAGKSEGSLFIYSGKSQKIMPSVHSYFCLDDNSVLITSNYKENQNEPSVSLFYYKDGKNSLIDENITLKYLRYHNLKNLAYVRNYNTKSGGELCIANGADKKVIDSGVNEIVMY